MVTINRAKDILNFWFGTGATPSKKKIQIAVKILFYWKILFCSSKEM